MAIPRGRRPPWAQARDPFLLPRPRTDRATTSSMTASRRMEVMHTWRRLLPPRGADGALRLPR
eukprot:7715972-Lingulodinium_polyedra.AAC.1